MSGAKHIDAMERLNQAMEALERRIDTIDERNSKKDEEKKQRLLQLVDKTIKDVESLLK